MLIFLLGLFGYYDHKILDNPLYNNFLALPYLLGYYIRTKDRDPDLFKEHGIIIFCGEQGEGKTLSLVRFAIKLKSRYKKALLSSNLYISYMDYKILHWRQMLNIINGKYGVIDCIDELGLWLNSKAQAKDFDASLLEITAQNRKNRRVILATAQQFYQVAKDVRTQTRYVVQCRTFLKIFTLNIYFKPKIDDQGNTKSMLPVKTDFFIHTPALYKCYDTMEMINTLKKDGFQEKEKKKND